MSDNVPEVGSARHARERPATARPYEHGCDDTEARDLLARDCRRIKFLRRGIGSESLACRRMELTEPEARPSDRRKRVLRIALGVGLGAVVLIVIMRRWKRRFGDGLADLAGEGIIELTDAIVEELLAS